MNLNLFDLLWNINIKKHCSSVWLVLISWRLFNSETILDDYSRRVLRFQFPSRLSLYWDRHWNPLLKYKVVGQKPEPFHWYGHIYRVAWKKALFSMCILSAILSRIIFAVTDNDKRKKVIATKCSFFLGLKYLKGWLIKRNYLISGTIYCYCNYELDKTCTKCSDICTKGEGGTDLSRHCEIDWMHLPPNVGRECSTNFQN